MSNEFSLKNVRKPSPEKVESSTEVETAKKLKAATEEKVDVAAVQDEVGIVDRNCPMLQFTTLEHMPRHADVLFDQFKLSTMTKADIFFQLAYIIALETGFAEQKVFEQFATNLQYTHHVSSYFNSSNVNILSQEKPTVSRDSSGTLFSMTLHSIASRRQLLDAEIDEADISVKMSSIVTGDFMIITLTPLQLETFNQSSNERSVCLSIPRYIVGNMENDSIAALKENLRNMQELVHKLRDELFVPVRNHHLALLRLDAYPSLQGMPFEVCEKIFSYLSPQQLRSMANVCLQFYYYLKDDDNVSFQSSTSRPSDNSISSYFEVEPYYRLV